MLRLLRRELNMGLQEFAIRIGCSFTHVSNMEHKRRRISKEIYERIEKAAKTEVALWKSECAGIHIQFDMSQELKVIELLQGIKRGMDDDTK